MSINPKKKDCTRKRIKLEPLESRTLYSGDPFSAGISAVGLSQDTWLTESGPNVSSVAETGLGLVSDLDLNTSASSSLEIVFIDDTAPDHEILTQDLLTNSSSERTFEIVIIGSQQDGIQVISDILATHTDVNAVHLISHGSDGIVNIGKTVLNEDTLSTYENAISNWGNAFTETGDLLIYGCDFSATEAGISLGANIAALADIDIASSDNRTGGADVGGDWVLEQVVGRVETSVPFSAELQDNYQRSLVSSISVSTVDDEVDAPSINSFDDLNANAGPDGKISLREAIIAANTQPGADTINLPAGSYKLTSAGGFTSDHYTGDHDITSDITITGAGSSLTSITALGLNDRVIEVHSGGTLNVSDLTIEDGTTRHGSGIYNSGTLITNNVIFQNNDAMVNSGGAINNTGSANISNTLFTYNEANGGGAIYITSGSVELTDSTIQNNKGLSSGGGGIKLSNGDLTISQSAFLYNEGSTGGGIRVGDTSTNTPITANITNSTFNGNVSSNSGGGVYAGAGDTTIRYSTFSENSASSGGGAYEERGTITIGSSIFAENTTPNTWGSKDVSNFSTSEGYNIIKSNQPSTSNPTDQIGVDPYLDIFDTISQTYPLNSLSPAIDQGGPPPSPNEDQRGVTRDSSPDVGAYEVTSVPVSNAPPAITPSSASKAYTENSVLIVDSTMSVTDTDSINFDSGVFTVTNSGFNEATDVVSINPAGIGLGEVNLSGSSVLYEGNEIGTWTGGTGTTALTVNLNSAASVSAVNALAQSITFTHNSENPSSTSRTLTYKVTDGDGGTSAPIDINIDVVPVNDAPLINSHAPVVVINELHYDDDGDDDNEAIEIAGTAGIDLNGWSIEFYSDGTEYGTLLLSGIVPDEGNGFGALHFPRAPIQNGSNDAIALIDDTGTVVEFISYEGTQTATADAAAGMTSVDIGVSENNSADALDSLKRKDLTINSSWLPTSANSFGFLNSGQTSPINSSHVINEDSTLTFSVADNTAIEISDPDTSTNLELTVSVTSGLLAFSSSPASTNTTLTFTGSLADINTELDGLRYTPNPDYHGTDTLTVLIEDQDPAGSLSDTVDIDIIVNPVNDAPAGANLTLSTNEDSFITLQSTNFGFSDAADGDLFAAVTVVTPPTNGTLSLATAAVTAGQLISISDINSGDLVFTPTADENGANYADFEFHVHDNGGTANGGTDSDPVAKTITFDVSAVNDPPVSLNPNITIYEDTPYFFSVSDFPILDIDNDSLSFITIRMLPTEGQLELGGIAVTENQVIDQADIANLSFTPPPHATQTPPPDASGSTLGIFSYQITDDGGTINGGSDTEIRWRAVLATVNSVNDAPAGADKTISTPEDTAYTFSSADFGFTDVIDNDAFLAVVIDSEPANGQLVFSGSPVTAGQAIDINQIGSLQFFPETNVSQTGYDSIAFSVQDDGGTAYGGVDTDPVGNNIFIDIVEVNDAPTGTDQTFNFLEDTARPFSTSDFGFTDPVDNNNLQSIILTSLPNNGNLLLSGSSVTQGQTISESNINSLVFVPEANANGAAYTNFSFQVQDDGGVVNGGVDTDPTANSLNFNITSVNDTPEGTNTTLSTGENTPIPLSAVDFGFTDLIDGDNFSAITVSPPATGSLNLAGMPVSANDLISITAINSGALVFTPAPNTSGANYTTIGFQVHDDGGTTNGGIDQDQTPNTITIDVFDINNAPSGTNNTLTINEDTPVTLLSTDFGFSDSIDANQLAAVTITTVPPNGTLKLANSTINSGQTISITDINNGDLVFTPGTDENGSGYTSFDFQVHDDGGTANNGIDQDQSPNTLTFNVLSTNDAPEGTNNTLRTDENSPLILSANDFGFSDAIEGDNFTAITVSPPANGSLALDGAAINSNDVISITNISNGDLVFTPASNTSGVSYTTISFQVHDNGGTANGGVDIDPTPNQIIIDVLDINNAPAGTDNTLTADEDTAITLQSADFGFSDAIDGNFFAAVTIATLPSNGTLTLTNAPVTIGQLISITRINNGDLVFTPVAEQNGPSYANFEFQVHDDGGTANGGIDQDQTANKATIDVLSVSDAPYGTDNTITTVEDTPLVIQSSDFGFADLADGDFFAAITVSTLPSNGTLTLNGSTVSAGQVISVTNIINGELLFIPMPDQNGLPYADFTFVVHDTGSTNNGGAIIAQTPSILTIDVLPVNDAPVGSNSSEQLTDNLIKTLTLSDFGFTDTENHILQSVIINSAPTNGALTLNGVAVNAGDTLTYIDLLTTSVHYTPAQNISTQDFIDFTITDNGGTAIGGSDTSAQPARITIDVAALNDAPTATDNTILLEEDSSHIFSRADFGFADPLNSHGFAELLVSTLSGDGTFSLNGAQITAPATVNSADINSGLLKFTPDPDANGNNYSTLDFKVRDDGGTTNGGQDTSLINNTITLNVTPVNDAPQGSDATFTLLEDQSITLSLADIGYSDPADNHQLSNALVTIAPTVGELLLSGTPLVAGDSIPLSSLNNGEVVFVPSNGTSGTSYDSFSFQVQDSGGIANNGTDTDASPATLTFNVVEVSDAPSGADKLISTNEDTDYIFSLTDFGFSDPSEGTPDQIQSLEVTQIPVTGSLTNSGIAVGTGQVVSATDISAGNLIYTPSPNTYGQAFDNLLFQVIDTGNTLNGGENQDQTANQILFDINGVSDAPKGTDSTRAINENTSYTLQALDFGFSDTSDGDLFSAITVVDIPASGTLTLAGNTISANQVISITAINNGDLVYQPSVNDNGNSYADFTFLIHDTGTTAYGGQNISQNVNTAVFNIVAVNDAPTGLSNSSQTTDDTAYVLSSADFPFTDTENHALKNIRIDSLPVSGIVTLNSAAISAGSVISAADLAAGNLIYQPALNVATQDVIGFTVIDNGGTSNGGTDTQVTPTQLTITTLTVNDAPIAADKNLLINEDTEYTLTVADFGFADPAEQHGFSDVVITAVSGGGTLTLGGSPIIASAVVPVADINAAQLAFTPDSNASGFAYAAVEFMVKDDGGTANGGQNTSQSHTLTFDVAEVNDAPSGTDGTLGSFEDTPRALTPADFGFSDADNNQFSEITITTIPALGSLQLDGQTVFTGDQIPVNSITQGKLSYLPASNINGVTSFSFAVVDDGGTSNNGQNTDPTANTLTLNVLAINDTPDATDTTVSINEDQIHQASIANFSFIDPIDGHSLQEVIITTLPVDGQLSNNGIPVTAGDAISATDIAAGNLLYAPASDNFGLQQLTFQVRDDGGTANGGTDIDASPNTLNININAVNDAPSGQSATFNIIESSSHVFERAEFGFTDTQDNHNFTSIIISSLSNANELSLAGVPVSVGDEIDVTDIDADLLTYTPTVTGVIHQIGFQVRDSGSPQNGDNTDQSENLITFDLTLVNDAPSLTNERATYAEGSDNTISTTVLAATDPDDPALDLSFTIQTIPENGVLKINDNVLRAGDFFSMQQLTNNELQYSHDGSETSSDYFDFALSDGGEDGVLPITARFNIDITEVIDPIIPIPDSALTLTAGDSFDTALSDVLNSGEATLFNGSLLGSGLFEIDVIEQPTYGTLTLNPDGTFLYNHDGSSNTTDSFVYRVTNQDGASATATVNIVAEPTINYAIEEPVTPDFPVVTVPVNATFRSPLQEPAPELAVETINQTTAEPTLEPSTSSEAEAVDSEQQTDQLTSLSSEESLFSVSAILSSAPFEEQLSSLSNATYTDYEFQFGAALVERDLLRSLDVRQHNDADSIYLFEINDKTRASISSIDLQIDSPTTVYETVNNKDFLRGLSRAQSDLETADNRTRTTLEAGGEVAISVSISTTAGILAWMLRGGAIFGSLMAATPLWSSIDPLRVTDGKRRDEEGEKSEVEDMFK